LVSAVLASPGRKATVRWQITQRVTGSWVTVTGKFLATERDMKKLSPASLPYLQAGGNEPTAGGQSEYRLLSL
jgi:hypothetical protein